MVKELSKPNVLLRLHVKCHATNYLITRMRQLIVLLNWCDGFSNCSSLMQLFIFFFIFQFQSFYIFSLAHIGVSIIKFTPSKSAMYFFGNILVLTIYSYLQYIFIDSIFFSFPRWENSEILQFWNWLLSAILDQISNPRFGDITIA